MTSSGRPERSAPGLPIPLLLRIGRARRGRAHVLLCAAARRAAGGHLLPATATGGGGGDPVLPDVPGRPRRAILRRGGRRGAPARASTDRGALGRSAAAAGRKGEGGPSSSSSSSSSAAAASASSSSSTTAVAVRPLWKQRNKGSEACDFLPAAPHLRRNLHVSGYEVALAPPSGGCGRLLTEGGRVCFREREREGGREGEGERESWRGPSADPEPREGACFRRPASGRVCEDVVFAARASLAALLEDAVWTSMPPKRQKPVSGV